MPSFHRLEGGGLKEVKREIQWPSWNSNLDLLPPNYGLFHAWSTLFKEGSSGGVSKYCGFSMVSNKCQYLVCPWQVHGNRCATAVPISLPVGNGEWGKKAAGSDIHLFILLLNTYSGRIVLRSVRNERWIKLITWKETQKNIYNKILERLGEEWANFDYTPKC